MVGQVNPTDVFAIHRWVPIQASVFLDELNEIPYTLDEPKEIKTTVDLLDDHRIRRVVHAYAKPLDFEGTGDEYGPWLMSLHDEERGKTVYFRRCDVRLCSDRG